MDIKRLGALVVGLTFGAAAGAAFQLSGASAAVQAQKQPAAVPMPSPSAAATCQSMPLAIAFTSNVGDTSALNLHLPWGRPGDSEGEMIEDYGAYNGTTIREHLPVHDVTTGTLVEQSGHNAIDIILESGSPLYAVTSGTAYQLKNWTLPGGPQGWATVVISDVLKDDQGDPIAFLYGHVREFEVANGQRVAAGALIARSGGDPDDPGAGFSDLANVHFEIIESANPLAAHAGTVNPHRFLENLYDFAAHPQPGCTQAS
jgi:murein DD-endopeptidase MepM/ murein hydrolase activator NlpD